ncbi:DUF624 domain-containing protein [Bifidobacterium choloepi]|uniref:DUF624 domain-containing protein n=1 Tax=Bifidobacterium choloepi TaxID=2614131 RepID=A0A6I5N4C1_9BIFI|nr:DUF624 domain-containing protein [Bifidobacterium choloepi]NEG70529.1 DUF624 domain-containing protein [Bifidobacterium choloepi]
MKFNIDGPFWRFMGTLVRFVALNIVYLITLIPIVTYGPAQAALYGTLFAYDQHDDVRLVREYLRRFKREFKQGIVSGLLLLVLILAVIFGLSFWNAWDADSAYVPLVLMLCGAVVTVMIYEFLFPIQARFVNPIRRQWVLAATFPWRAFPCALLLVGIDVVALALTYFVPFVRVMMLLFGFCWVAYAKSLLLLWGFRKYGGYGEIEHPTYVNANSGL